jgi:hypothetical protein
MPTSGESGAKAFHRARAAMYRARASRHEARATAFGAKRDTPCKMQLVAGRLGLDGQTQIRLPDEFASELAESSYVVELPDGTTGKPNDEQACLIAALRGRISLAKRWMDDGSTKSNVDATGMYVATLTDWNGYEWSARLASVDENGDKMHYKTNKGTLVFRRKMK